jgi:hypothetical protein
MAISVRNTYSGYPANTQSSVVVVAGDLIIVAYSYSLSNQLDTLACTDNASGGSNTYASVGTGVTTRAATGMVFYAVAKNSETLTITCPSKSDGGISVHVVSGLNGTLSTVLDVYDGGPTLEDTTHSTGSITTRSANEYLFAFWFQESIVGTPTDNGTGFTLKTNQSGHIHQTFDKIVSSTGSYSSSISSASAPYNYILAGFSVTAETAVTPKKYWVGGSGTWDATSSSHWSLTSGGTAGATAPSSMTEAVFDANSFTSSGDTVTVSTNAYSYAAGALNVDSTGVLHTPTIHMSTIWYVYGDLTLENITITGASGAPLAMLGSTTSNIKTNTVQIGADIEIQSGHNVNLLDDLNVSGNILGASSGLITTNNHSIITSLAIAVGPMVAGSSTITCQGFEASSTFTAGTSTIIINGDYFSGNAQSYYAVVLNDSVVLSSNDNTFHDLTFSPGATITVAAGTTQTITNSLTADGSTSAIVLLSNAPGTQYTFTKASGAVSVTGVTLSDSNVTGGATWEDVDGTDSGNNTGWTFTSTSHTYTNTETGSVSFTGSQHRLINKILHRG